MKGVKNSKKIPLNGTNASSQTPKKFLACYSIVIKVQDILYNFKWHSYNILNHLKWRRNKKVMRFENKRGPKRKKGKTHVL
jgi:hypothetical protein